MHALTCDILDSGTFAYAMIPTYYDPSKFIAAKVYIEWTFHSETSIFYHCIVTELIDDDNVLLQTLPTCLLRSIERRTGKLGLNRPAMQQFSLDKQSMLNDLQAWHKDFVIDLPAPFIAKDQERFEQLKLDIYSYFRSMLTNVQQHLTEHDNRR